MAYDHVFSEDPPIIVTEADDGLYHIYAEGELVGLAHGSQQAKELAHEVFDAITGDDLSEEEYE